MRTTTTCSKKAPKKALDCELTRRPEGKLRKCPRAGCRGAWCEGTQGEKKHQRKCDFGWRWYDFRVCLCVYLAGNPDPDHAKTCVLQILSRSGASECQDLGKRIRAGVMTRLQLTEAAADAPVEDVFPVHSPPMSPFSGTVLDPSIFEPVCIRVQGVK